MFGTSLDIGYHLSLSLSFFLSLSLSLSLPPLLLPCLAHILSRTCTVVVIWTLFLILHLRWVVILAVATPPHPTSILQAASMHTIAVVVTLLLECPRLLLPRPLTGP